MPWFLAQNAPKCVWRPGSARTRWGSLSAPPRPPSRNKGCLLLREGRDGEREGRTGETRGGEGRAVPLSETFRRLWYVYTNVCKTSVRRRQTDVNFRQFRDGRTGPIDVGVLSGIFSRFGRAHQYDRQTGWQNLRSKYAIHRDEIA